MAIRHACSTRNCSCTRGCRLSSTFLFPLSHPLALSPRSVSFPLSLFLSLSHPLYLFPSLFLSPSRFVSRVTDTAYTCARDKPGRSTRRGAVAGGGSGGRCGGGGGVDALSREPAEPSPRPADLSRRNCARQSRIRRWPVRACDPRTLSLHHVRPRRLLIPMTPVIASASSSRRRCYVGR